MNDILIVGTGSIGKRHIDNFTNHFDNIDIVDINKERLDDVRSQYNVRNAYTDFEKAFLENKYLATAITAPPHVHLPIATAAAKNKSNLFIEKPLGINTSGWNDVIKVCDENDIISYVAFCHRHIPYTQRFKEILKSKKYGKVLHANVRWGSYLPDWHPWEDYRTFYMAKKEQGGGALLDESHGVDLARFFFGEIKMVSAIIDNLSSLEISSDDSAFLTLKSENGIIIQISFDLYSRNPRVSFEAVCEHGTIIWDRVDHEIKIFDKAGDKWINEKYSRDDLMSMYPTQALYFYECIKKNIKPDLDIHDGLATQKVLDAAFESSETCKNVII